VNIGYLVLMVLAGMIIPVMASLNAALAMQLKSVPSATVVFSLVAFGVAVVILLSASLATNNPHHKAFNHLNEVPIIYLLGGVGVVLYITAVSAVGPKVGIAGSLACVFFGQMLSIIFIDHYGLFGMPRVGLSLARCFGVLVMMVGVALVLMSNNKV